MGRPSVKPQAGMTAKARSVCTVIQNPRPQRRVAAQLAGKRKAATPVGSAHVEQRQPAAAKRRQAEGHASARMTRGKNEQLPPAASAMRHPSRPAYRAALRPAPERKEQHDRQRCRSQARTSVPARREWAPSPSKVHPPPRARNRPGSADGLRGRSLAGAPSSTGLPWKRGRRKEKRPNHRSGFKPPGTRTAAPRKPAHLRAGVTRAPSATEPAR